MLSVRMLKQVVHTATFPKGYHRDVVGGPSIPHDPESDAGGRLSSGRATQASKVKDEGRS
jgi:hypothetical protein